MPDGNKTKSPAPDPAALRRTGGFGAISFLVGGLVVAAGLLGFVFWSGGVPEGLSAGTRDAQEQPDT